MKCKACGKQLASGPGVYLPPIKLRIFEIIRRAGRDGITRAELLSEYGEGLHDACRRVRPPITMKTISAHVIQINEVLRGTGYRISDARGGSHGKPYRLIRTGEAAR
jgi:hypothetical protein